MNVPCNRSAGRLGQLRATGAQAVSKRRQSRCPHGSNHRRAPGDILNEQ